MTLRLALEVNPVPAARPVVVFRHGRSGAHAFTPDGTRDFYHAFAWAVRAAGIRRPLAGRLRVHLRLWRRCRGSARGDLDNLIKAVLDAGTGLLYADDDQVTEIEAVLVAWGPHVVGRIEMEIIELAREIA